MGFGGPPSRDSGRSVFKPEGEDALQRHYHVLKGYLASSLRDEKGNIKPNKARDKLLRLSVTQFMELSTDVFDELLRREDDRMQRVQNVPRFLPPKQNFHPKRNQARQKLSTLPVERFRQLATDVFYELERRIPRLAANDIERPISSTSSNRGQSRNGMRPPPGGYRGPPQGAGPRPGMAPPLPSYQSFRPASPGLGAPSPGTRPPTGGSDSSNYGRPLPKTFQSNTIVPNKSTMVEDDDDDEVENEDAFMLDKARSGVSSERFSKSTNAGAGSAEDKEKIRAQEAEIAELRDKVETLESSVLDREQELESLKGTLLDKEQDLEKARSSGQDREEGLSAERNEWYNLQEELEQKHLDYQRLNEELEEKHLQAQQLNESLQRELDQLKRSKSQDEHEIRSQHDRELEDLQAQLGETHSQAIEDLRAQLDNVHEQTGELHRKLELHQADNEELRDQLQDAQQPQRALSNDDHERRIELLQEELASQEKLTNEVRDEAMLYLQEMRDLSRQNDYAIEQEEKLAARVTQLEREIETWRQRYARVKAQNKSLRASTLGLGLQTSFDVGSLVRKEGVLHQGGLVRDVDVTRFQMAVDELLQVARQAQTEPMLESVKTVVVSVQHITAAVSGTDGYPTPSPSPLSPNGGQQQRQLPADSVAKLKARVTGTANSLITATKQHASASGLSPVALLDAAASNLTASVVELIKAVGIRSSPTSELHSDVELDQNDDEEEEQDMASFYDDRLSPNEQSPALAPAPLGATAVPHTTPLAVHSPSPSVQISSPPSEAKPAPLNIGRSNTTKKTNGWFGGWGKKSSVDETAPVSPALPEPNGQGGDQEEYDPYR